MLLLFAVGLAMAGEGNRVAWGAFFIVLSVSLGSIAQHIAPPSGMEGVAAGMAMCVAVPVVPALILWSAHAFGKRRPG